MKLQCKHCGARLKLNGVPQFNRTYKCPKCRNSLLLMNNFDGGTPQKTHTHTKHPKPSGVLHESPRSEAQTEPPFDKLNSNEMPGDRTCLNAKPANRHMKFSHVLLVAAVLLICLIAFSGISSIFHAQKHTIGPHGNLLPPPPVGPRSDSPKISSNGSPNPPQQSSKDEPATTRNPYITIPDSAQQPPSDKPTPSYNPYDELIRKEFRSSLPPGDPRLNGAADALREHWVIEGRFEIKISNVRLVLRDSPPIYPNSYGYGYSKPPNTLSFESFFFGKERLIVDLQVTNVGKNIAAYDFAWQFGGVKKVSLKDNHDTEYLFLLNLAPRGSLFPNQQIATSLTFKLPEDFDNKNVQYLILTLSNAVLNDASNGSIVFGIPKEMIKDDRHDGQGRDTRKVPN